MVEFEIIERIDKKLIKVCLTTDEWIIEFHCSYLNWQTGEFKIYGDEPKVTYIGPLDSAPDFPYNEQEINNLIINSKWKD